MPGQSGTGARHSLGWELLDTDVRRHNEHPQRRLGQRGERRLDRGRERHDRALGRHPMVSRVGGDRSRISAAYGARRQTTSWPLAVPPVPSGTGSSGRSPRTPRWAPRRASGVSRPTITGSVPAGNARPLERPAGGPTRAACRSMAFGGAGREQCLGGRTWPGRSGAGTEAAGRWSRAERRTTSRRFGAPRATDVWAVGYGGIVLHWNGTSWSTSTQRLSADWLYGVWGSGPSDVWVVGSGGHHQALERHRTGLASRATRPPGCAASPGRDRTTSGWWDARARCSTGTARSGSPATSGTSKDLYAVRAVGSDVVAVGAGGTILALRR